MVAPGAEKSTIPSARERSASFIGATVTPMSPPRRSVPTSFPVAGAEGASKAAATLWPRSMRTPITAIPILPDTPQIPAFTASPRTR